MKLAILAIALAGMGASLPALADDDELTCGNAPRDQWMSEADARARGAELGYEVRSVKTEDGCYELYATDRNGARVELYLNPVSGDMVRAKEDD